jgi:hypothetical protein
MVDDQAYLGWEVEEAFPFVEFGRGRSSTL